MDDLMWCARITSTRCICVSPLSAVTIQENLANHLGGDGYFIYEVEDNSQDGGIQILGKAASEEGDMRLVNIFLATRAAQDERHTHVTERRRRLP